MKSPLSYSRLYGLVGYPLAHSFSRDFFNRKFQAEGIDALYVNFEMRDIGQLVELVAAYPNLAGLNVTAPHKQAVIPWLDSLDDDARRVGAVNVIAVERDPATGRLTGLRGHNTDVSGFDRSLPAVIDGNCSRAMVLGTGGAARAVTAALERRGIDVQLVSRRKSERVLVYEEITRAMVAACQLVVNATPLGRYPAVDECPDFPYRFLTAGHLCYDLTYNPDETLFMRNAARHGARVKNGIEMLILQAFDSYEIWTRGDTASASGGQHRQAT